MANESGLLFGQPSPYGTCPRCGAPVTERERRIDGNDRCANGHVYPSKETIPNKLDPDVATISGAATHLLNALHNAGIQPSDVMLVLGKDDFKRLVMRVTHVEAQGDKTIEVELPGPGFGVRINGLRITAI